MATVSAYRHIFGEPSKADKGYNEVNISTTTADSNLLAANARFVAVPWESRGGGLFAVLDVKGSGKIGTSAPLFSGHAAGVTDLAFSPFNDFLIASAADDATIRLWNIPVEDGKIKSQNESLAVLKGHGRRVGRVVFNPIVENALATYGAENAIKLWDISKGTAVVTFKAAKDNLLDLNWSQDGNLLVYPAKDKMLHMVDIRNAQEVFAVKGHPGLRGGRAVFYDNLNYIATTGFSQTAARQISVRDKRNPEQALVTEDVDFNTGVLAPFIDPDTGVLFTFSRGDTAAKYYELRGDETPLYALSAFNSSDSIRAFAHAPKYAVDTTKCEIDRFYVVTQSKNLITLPFIVPRRNAEFFQEDLYPETNAPEPAISFDEWKEGGNGVPKKMSLENGYQLPDAPGAFSVQREEPEDPVALRAGLNAAQKTIDELKARVAELEKEIAAAKAA